ncbi:type II secretion system F family protein [Clostridium manihotivorum]|uniref:Type II secretion system protein GspF domain-containing protein n=1 Tax=Clostridium manihotivorum TaxID=2320868 RepID=A0A410DSP0_9CLOT|nr:type II secretion system F family protein [Clostridium manihotivorum]QAA32048.1 hypothetical protein C1I91_10495 [Clostridium manihotivorum]
MIKNKVNYDSIIRISSDLAILLSSGISIFNSFEILANSISNKRYKNILKKIIEKIREGSTLSEAFGSFTDYFPKLFIQMLFIGESSGNLVTALEELSTFYKIKSEIRKKIFNLSIYPMMLLGTLVTMIVFYIQVITPSIGEFVKGMDNKIPWYTEKILSGCKFIRENNALVMTALICWGIGTAFLLYLIAKNKAVIAVVSRSRLIRGFKEVLEIEALLLIIKCGIPLVHGLEILIDTFSSGNIEYGFNDIKASINNGVTLSEAFASTESFSDLTLSMITVGEESGRLEYTLERLKDMLMDNFKKALDRLTALIQPILILVIGVIVCFLILIMMVPIYSSLNV